MAADAPSTMKMLGKEATCNETTILGAFEYVDRAYVACLSGQRATQSLQLLHQKLHVSYIKSKGREEYGFMEIINAGVVAADGMLRRNFGILDNPEHMLGRRRYNFHLPRHRE
ncbi:hypothetical protein KY290_019500 [Solanum tuberosum]|uniref:Uncharacterized protein n=1 Tax=Solanum tuberosum TaxID=4113 RepID=A0ABQ7VH72_SOLTU|nr:hypothetical protein KY284_017375 [Solanum tuberosum]KAH0763427.1 hypothetical protein KY290_019500 [Solanum tuberosum]